MGTQAETDFSNAGEGWLYDNNTNISVNRRGPIHLSYVWECQLWFNPSLTKSKIGVLGDIIPLEPHRYNFSVCLIYIIYVSGSKSGMSLQAMQACLVLWSGFFFHTILESHRQMLIRSSEPQVTSVWEPLIYVQWNLETLMLCKLKTNCCRGIFISRGNLIIKSHQIHAAVFF